MDEQVVAIVSTEGAIKRAIKQVREALKNADEGSSFYFNILASGRIQDGDVKLQFTLADNEYGSEKVMGHAIQPVVDEYLRRKGWGRVNAPLAISFQEVPA